MKHKGMSNGRETPWYLLCPSIRVCVWTDEHTLSQVPKEIKEKNILHNTQQRRYCCYHVLLIKTPCVNPDRLCSVALTLVIQQFQLA